MKKSLKKLTAAWLLLFGTGVLVFVSCQPSHLVLAENESSDYSIVVPDSATTVTRAAADTLAAFISRMSGATLPVVKQSEAGKGNLLWLGCRPGDPALQFPDTLGSDGFAIRFDGKNILIAGNTPAGTQNGVYAFLEDYLGCRFYANDGMMVPRTSIITLQPVPTTQKPAFSFREIHGPEPLNHAWRDWHRVHRKEENSPEWGMFVHTFQKLVPVDEWFASHPEYFSQVGGVRIADGQLCLSNPAVFDLVMKNLRTEMALKPNALYWSVSQNDTYKNCECAACRRLDSLYGGPSGTMIWFVNQVADSFPDKIISTLAYQYTRQAPRNITPRDNVNVMLCTIECDRARTVPDDEGFARDITQWSQLTRNIFLWDYVVQFRNYLDPFPNLHVLQPNLRFFGQHNIPMMFQQGSGRSWSDMVELKQYLIAKLLWNPDADVEAITNDFLQGYYGEAGAFVGRYLTLRQKALLDSKGRLGIYGFPWDGFNTYLTPALMNRYDQLADSALQAVAGNVTLTARVQKAFLPLIFARLDIALHEPDTTFSFVKREGSSVTIKPAMRALLDTLVNRSERLHVFDADERGTTPASYRQEVLNLLKATANPGKGYRCKVTMPRQPSEKYPVGGSAALTDGIRGMNDYNVNWAGFYGNEMEAVVDLGSVQPVDTVTATFLQFHQAWIFLPKTVTVELSDDGQHFTRAGTALNPHKPEKTGSFTHDFMVKTPEARARYIRLTTTSLLRCPDWHPGHGLESWIFVDEVVVK